MGACLSGPDDDKNPSTKLRSRCKFNLDPEFQVNRKLGQGGQGAVYSCVHKASNTNVAVKLIKRPISDWQAVCLTREVQLQSQLVHVNIVRLRDLLLTPSHLGLVMDLCAGGSLAGAVKKPVDEDTARFYMHQLLPALQFMHEHRVVHRDLKLDNVLIDNQSPPTLKLCDFGVAKRWAKRRMPHMRTIAGTPAYVAPDVLQGAFMDRQAPYDGTKADVWSLGVMLCYMLVGHGPFGLTQGRMDGSDVRTELHRVWAKARHGSWHMLMPPKAREIVAQLSPDCRDFLQKAFTKEPTARPSVAALMQHPWFTAPLQPHHAAKVEQLQQEQERLAKLELAIPSADFTDMLLSKQMSGNMEAVTTKPELLAAMGEARMPYNPSDPSGPALRCISLAPDNTPIARQDSVSGLPGGVPLSMAPGATSAGTSTHAHHATDHAKQHAGHAHPPANTPPPASQQLSGGMVPHYLSIVLEELGSVEKPGAAALASAMSDAPEMERKLSQQDGVTSPFEGIQQLVFEQFEALQPKGSTPKPPMPNPPTPHSPPIAPVKLMALNQASAESIPSISSFPLAPADDVLNTPLPSIQPSDQSVKELRASAFAQAHTQAQAQDHGVDGSGLSPAQPLPTSLPTPFRAGPYAGAPAMTPPPDDTRLAARDQQAYPTHSPPLHNAHIAPTRNGDCSPFAAHSSSAAKPHAAAPSATNPTPSGPFQNGASRQAAYQIA